MTTIERKKKFKLEEVLIIISILFWFVNVVRSDRRALHFMTYDQYLGIDRCFRKQFYLKTKPDLQYKMQCNKVSVGKIEELIYYKHGNRPISNLFIHYDCALGRYICTINFSGFFAIICVNPFSFNCFYISHVMTSGFTIYWNFLVFTAAIQDCYSVMYNCYWGVLLL